MNFKDHNMDSASSFFLPEHKLEEWKRGKKHLREIFQRRYKSVRFLLTAVFVPLFVLVV